MLPVDTANAECQAKLLTLVCTSCNIAFSAHVYFLTTSIESLPTL